MSANPQAAAVLALEIAVDSLAVAGVGPGVISSTPSGSIAPRGREPVAALAGLSAGDALSGNRWGGLNRVQRVRAARGEELGGCS